MWTVALLHRRVSLCLGHSQPGAEEEEEKTNINARQSSGPGIHPLRCRLQVACGKTSSVGVSAVISEGGLGSQIVEIWTCRHVKVVKNHVWPPDAIIQNRDAEQRRATNIHLNTFKRICQRETSQS